MIRLTKLADYGIVLLSHVATKLPGEIFTAKQLADVAQIPSPMASKILKILARNDLLVSHRGVNGGYSLGREAESITVADVIRALEGPIALTRCVPDPEGCEHSYNCPANAVWATIQEQIGVTLRSVTLEALISAPRRNGRVEFTPGQTSAKA